MTLRIRQKLIGSGVAGAFLLACATALAITPEELQRELARPNPPTVIDVRKDPAQRKKTTGSDAKAASEENLVPLTDLSVAFPGKPITKSPHQLPAQSKGKAAAAPATPPILVLIDNGDGSAQDTARE